MFRKKNRRSKNKEAPRTASAPSKEVLEAFIERDLFDDHGPAIIGNRKDKPKF